MFTFKYMFTFFSDNFERDDKENHQNKNLCSKLLQQTVKEPRPALGYRAHLLSSQLKRKHNVATQMLRVRLILSGVV